MSTALNTRKRGLNAAGLDAANIVDSPRKRRNVQQPQEESTSKSPSPPPPAIKKITLRLRKKSNTAIQDYDSLSDPNDDNGSTAGSDDQPTEQEVSELGQRLWNTIKNAKDDNGRHMATDFLELPSKRKYPEYYKVIKRPISLEEIKTKLLSYEYKSLSSVKADFDLMFKNAKHFNEKNSGIWLDAQNLHNLVAREYTILTGASNAHDNPSDDEDGDEYTDNAKSSKGKKARSNPLITTIKTRLGKLLKKKDPSGRSYSDAFIELPSKKEWAIYYEVIKKPISFDIIEKKLNRGHYDSVQAFINDVELMFSNAFEFNEEHSPIWEDAKYLQDQFRELMADLITPATASNTAGGSVKIKLKVGAQSQAAETPSAQSKANRAASSTAPELKPQAIRPMPSSTTPSTSSKALPQLGAAPSYPPTTSSTPAPSVPPTAAPPTQSGAYGLTPNSAATTYQNQVAQYVASLQAAGYPYQSLPPHLQQYLQQAQQAGQPPGAASASLNPYQGYTQWGGASPAPRGFTPNQTPPAYGSPMAGTVPLAGSVPPPGTRADASATPPIESSSSTQVATATSSKAHTAVDEPSIKIIKSVSFRTLPVGRNVTFNSIEGVDLRLWSLRLGLGETGAEIVGIEMFSVIESPEPIAEKPKRPRRGRPPKNAKGKGKDDGKMDDDDDDAVGEEVDEAEDEENKPSKNQSASREVEVKVNDITIMPTPSVLPALNLLGDLSPDATLIASTPDTSVNLVNGNGVTGEVSESEEESEDEDAEGDDDDGEGEEDEQPPTRTRGKGKANATRSRSPSKKQSSSKSSPKSSRKQKSTKKKAGKNGAAQNDEAIIVDHRKWEFGLSLGRNVVDVKVGASIKTETWRVFMERVL
ncbi:hypothetical protein FRC02_001953 [Tulasnella sp. 418]|nr:hypothetical protein FRC02_001953 [Tulasnella sp. 418]